MYAYHLRLLLALYINVVGHIAVLVLNWWLGNKCQIVPSIQSI